MSPRNKYRIKRNIEIIVLSRWFKYPMIAALLVLMLVVGCYE